MQKLTEFAFSWYTFSNSPVWPGVVARDFGVFFGHRPPEMQSVIFLSRELKFEHCHNIYHFYFARSQYEHHIKYCKLQLTCFGFSTDEKFIVCAIIIRLVDIHIFEAHGDMVCFWCPNGHFAVHVFFVSRIIFGWLIYLFNAKFNLGFTLKKR